MKTWKLVAGIISAVLFVIVVFQSCAAGVSNALESSGETSGTTGMIVGILMLAGGIVSIATRNTTDKSIVLVILFGLAALIGIIGHGNYTDLIVWGAWCAVNAIVALIAMIKNSKAKKNASTPATPE